MSTHDNARAILAEIRIRPAEATQLQDALEHLMSEVPPSDRTRRALHLAILEWHRSLHDVGEEGCSLAELQERVLAELAPIQTTAGGHDPNVWSQIYDFILKLLPQARDSPTATFAKGVLVAKAINLDSTAGTALVAAMIAVVCMSSLPKAITKHPILFLAANPSGTDKLALDRECAEVELALCLTPGRDDFDFRSKWAVSVDEMMRHLNEWQPTIVHFSGHGGRPGRDLPAREQRTPRRDVDDDGPGDAEVHAGIYLHGELGAQYVSERALEQMITNAAPSARIVVLSACYSVALAESLRVKVDCIIGMNGSIADDAARSFAVAFYRALGHHRSVGNAFAQAVATLDAKHQAGCVPQCRTRDGIAADQLFLSSPRRDR